MAKTKTQPALVSVTGRASAGCRSRSRSSPRPRRDDEYAATELVPGLGNVSRPRALRVAASLRPTYCELRLY
jgi:hypothetical protein